MEYIGIAVGLGVVGVVVWICRAFRRARRTYDRKWASVAAALGGAAEPRYWTSRATVRYKVGEHAAQIESDGNSPYTWVSVSLEGKSPGTLVLTEDLGTPDLIKKMFGVQDLSTGDAKFDQEYTVQATPPTLAYRIFAPDRRAAAMASTRRLKGAWQPVISLSRDALEVRVSGGNLEEREILAMAQVAEQFVGYVGSLGPAEGIRWGEAELPNGAPCPVCGTPMVKRLVRCMKCRAPHHEECWLYARRCSTFACGEARYFELFDEEARRA